MADSTEAADAAAGEGHLNNHCSDARKFDSDDGMQESSQECPNHSSAITHSDLNNQAVPFCSDTRGVQPANLGAPEASDGNTFEGTHAATRENKGEANSKVPSNDDVENNIEMDLHSVSSVTGASGVPENPNTETLVLGKLKKDDSGIDMEKSPSKDGYALSEESEANHTDSEVNLSKGDSGRVSQSESAKDDSKLDVDAQSCEIRDDSFMDRSYVPDSIDTEDSEPTGSYNVTQGEGEESGSEAGTGRVHRKRRLGFRLSSSSDSDSDSTTSERSAKTAKSSDSDVEMDLDLPPPKIWQMYNSLTKMEYGLNPRRPQSMFLSRLCGNLSLVQRLELQYKMEKHDGCVNALHFNNRGNLLASGSDDLKVIIWNWARNRAHLVFESGHRSNVFQAKFMPYSGDCHIVTCARDGQVRLAELSLTGICKGTKKLAQHKGAAHKLALQYDSPHEFLSCGEDAVTFQIDLRQEKPNKLLVTKEADKKVPLYSIHSNPNNSFEFCVGGRDHYIRIYDKRKIAEDGEASLKKFCPHHMVNSDLKANVTCCVYNYNGTEVLGTYNDEDIYLFDSRHSDGAEFIKRYRGHRNNATVKGVNFYGPRSEYIISGSDCSNVFLWEHDSERIVQYFEADEGGVINVLEPHPTGPFLATSGLDSDVKIWAPTAEEPTKLDGLKRVMKKNQRDRDEERMHEPEMLDNQMLWFLMHHLRRSSRRRAHGDGDDISSSSENSNSNSESEDSDTMGDGVQCVSS